MTAPAPDRPGEAEPRTGALHLPRGLAARLAVAFAIVALGTAVAVAVATPPIVGRGFAAMMAEQGSAEPGSPVTPGPGIGGSGMGPGGMGGGNGPGPGGGMGQGQAEHLAAAQAEATQSIILVALLAAGAASLLGIGIARWLARPLEHLERAAAAVAAGDLSARSGLAGRTDELGSLGRSFDAMAADLERAEASRRRFFQDAAHEMKTPLAVIDATSAALIDGVYAPDQRHLSTIREQARLLGRVVDDLRTISLAEARALPLALSDVSLEEVVRSVAGSFVTRAAGLGVTLVADPPPLPVLVRADRDRLVQAVATFVDNALRYAPSGSRVGMGAVRLPGTGSRLTAATPVVARIEVTDQGPGIPAADLPHLFDRFYQADAARDRATGTSGLGLAIARAIAEAHGGSVGAANRPEGGARFWLDLPALP